MQNNILLRALPDADKKVLAPLLERVALVPKTVLESTGHRSEFTYFPESGLCAVIARQPKRQIGVGVIGCDGMTAPEVVHNAGQAAHEVVVQAEGTALRIKSSVLGGLLESHPAMRHVLLRYAYFFLVQSSQTALTNAQARLEERLGRWILMAHDRTKDDVIFVTHEFISLMLGVRRAGVTTAIHVLEGNHLVRARRNRMEVLDRQGLIALTDGAYGFCEDEYERLIDRSFRVRMNASPEITSAAAG